jgi:hypothetical protein
MKIISVTSIEKEISKFQEHSGQFTIQQKSDPQLTLRTAQLNVRAPISVREDSNKLSIDTMQRPDDRAKQFGCYSVFEKILNSSTHAW